METMPKYPRVSDQKLIGVFLSLPLNTVPTTTKKTLYSWYHDDLFSVWIFYSVISVVDIKCLLMVFVKMKKVILSVNYWRHEHPQFFLCWIITRTNVCPTRPAATSIWVARRLGSHIRNSPNAWVTSRMDVQVLLASLTSGTSTEGVIQKRVVVLWAWKLASLL